AFAGMTSAYAGMTMWAMCVVLSVGVHPLRAERAGDQGYGVMVGNPSGLSAKYWLDEKAAIDGALGVARGEFDIHLTLLYHIFNWLPEGESRKDAFHRHVQNKELPLYVGIGPRLLFEHEEELGIRFPIGMSFLPQKSPWEIFFEVAPVLRLTPNGGFNGDFAVGVRYYIPAIRPKEMK
ncbi:MAG: hypothetical protein LHV69_06745, partial [Elusimicrobia bacterium]|nr:hypothetical protein [Candidatus Obscuribacterium magneticum]